MSRSMTFFLLGIAPVMALLLTLMGLSAISTNLLGWFLLIMGLAYFFGLPLYVWRRRKAPKPVKEERGDRSFWLMQPGFFNAVFAAPLEYRWLPELLPRTPGMQIVGLLLVAASVALLVTARRAIRGQFSGHVQIQPQHQLVQNGPFRLVRHPGYLGYLLLTLGIAIGFSSLISFAAVLVLLLPGLVYRMQVEEKLLVEAFGDQYRSYMERTKRLLPGIW